MVERKHRHPIATSSGSALVRKDVATVDLAKMGTYRGEVETSPGVVHRRVLTLEASAAKRWGPLTVTTFTDRLTRSEEGPWGSRDQTVELSGTFTVNGYQHLAQDFNMKSTAVTRYTPESPSPKAPTPLAGVSVPDLHAGFLETKNKPARPVPGMDVMIFGLSSAVELNGKVGRVQSYDAEAQRFNLLLNEAGLSLDADGQESLAQIKVENLKEIDPPERITVATPSSMMAPMGLGFSMGFLKAFPLLLDLDRPVLETKPEATCIKGAPLWS